MQTHSQPYKKTASCKTRVFDKHQEAEDDKTHSKLLFLLIEKGGPVLRATWGIEWERISARGYIIEDQGGQKE